MRFLHGIVYGNVSSSLIRLLCVEMGHIWDNDIFFFVFYSVFDTVMSHSELQINSDLFFCFIFSIRYGDASQWSANKFWFVFLVFYSVFDTVMPHSEVWINSDSSQKISHCGRVFPNKGNSVFRESRARDF